uniref:RRM domain-containing protein n=1 Tax=Emiliania huxleyi (strain CCMP1516) TaxID=280463 RepID=A0A0D3KA22_EMIH1
MYVGSMPNHATEDEIRAAFSKFGTVTDCFMPKDRETGEPRGFAFVTFEETRDADDAMAALDGKDFMGRTLRINKPRPRGSDSG